MVTPMVRARPLPIPLALPALAALAALAGCGGLVPDRAAGPARASTVADAAAACARLTEASAPGLRITEATFAAAGTQRARDPAGNREVGEPLPEHCIVRGRLDERTGTDAKPYHTGFELRLPSAFAGRLLYQGGGGNDGIVFNAVGRNTGALGWADNALSAASRRCPPTRATRGRSRASASIRRRASSMRTALTNGSRRRRVR